MDGDDNKLSKFLIEQARREWEEQRQDYHLARVATEFKKEFNEDYRDYLGEFDKLSKFARNLPELHVNQDRKLLAKIGIRPASARDEQPEKIEESKAPDRPSRVFNRSEISLIYFIRLLSDLPEEELQKIEIPISALTKIIKNNAS